MTKPKESSRNNPIGGGRRNSPLIFILLLLVFTAILTDVYAGGNLLNWDSFMGGNIILSGNITANNLTASILNVTNSLIGNSVTLSGNLTAAVNALFVNAANGRVGIGTLTPTHTLTVNGDVNLNNSLYLNKTTGNVGLNTTSPSNTLHVNGTFLVQTLAGITGLFQDALGNVGIGTTAPNQKLTVVGNMNLTGNLTVGEAIYTNDSLWQPVYPSDDGLVLYLPFSEGSGSSIAYDRSPYGNDGTLTNMNTTGNATSGWTAGKYGNALLFDGVDDYVDAGNAASLNSINATNRFTLSAWISIPASPTGGGEVISKGYPYLTFGTVSKTDHRLQFRISNTAAGNGDSNQLTSSTVLSTGAWNHVVAVLDGTVMNVYLNGKLDGSKTLTGQNIFDTSNFWIGGNNYGGYYNGTIDEVRIYNRALSAAELRTQYLQGLQSHGAIKADKFRVVNTNGTKVFEVNSTGLTVTNITASTFETYTGKRLDNVEETASYIIYTDGTTVYAKNGTTGKIDYSNVSAQDVINKVVNVSGRRVFVKAGTYNLTQPLLISSGVVLEGESWNTTILIDNSTSLIPGNTLYGAAIINKNYNSTLYNRNVNIKISNIGIVPNTNNAAIAFGGTTTVSLSYLYIDLSKGYRAIDFEASSDIEISSSRVDGKGDKAYYNYGIGSGLAGVSSYVGNKDFKIHDNTLLNITGDSFLFGSGDADVQVYGNYIEPGLYTGLGQFDAFFDIEGQQFYPAKNFDVHHNIMIGHSGATTAPNGILMGGNGQMVDNINIHHNLVDGNGALQAGQINGLGLGGANTSNGIITVSDNKFINVGTVQDSASVYAKQLRYINNYYKGIASNNVFINAPSNNINMTIVGNHIELGIFFNEGTYAMQNNTVAYNNWGAAPYYWGKRATAPVPFGAGDQFYNTSSNRMAYYNGTAWMQSLPDDGIASSTMSKFGIGTVRPDAKLDVNGAIRVRGESTISSGKGLELSYSAAGDYADIIAYDRDTSTAKNLRFSQGQTHFTGGNVGIGTTNPQSAFHVNSTTSNVYVQLPENNTLLAGGDCDAASEAGRMIFDRLNNNLYLCKGVSGWRVI